MSTSRRPAQDERISNAAYIGPGVDLGADVTIGPGAVILGPCVVGDRAWIGAGAQIGAPPEISSLEQNAAWAGALMHHGVRIGADAVVREGAIIHQGSYRETSLGARSWLLNRAYLAHDVLVGDDTTISAGVSVGGHCVIGRRANIGMNAAVHQRRYIGDGAMVGMSTPVTADIPPFATVFGSPLRLNGINSVGLEREGFEPTLLKPLLAFYCSSAFRAAPQDLPRDLQHAALPFAEWLRLEDIRPVVVDDRLAS